MDGTNFKQPKAKKKRRRLQPVGKSNRTQKRRSWQEEMMTTYAHIEWCEWFEGCGDTMGLAHAHSKKKTKITTREDWMDIAKLCQKHHDFVEHGSHERMYELIHKCIDKREE